VIIKGKSRGGAAALAAHLTSEKNERVEVAEIRGLLAQDLADALREMEDVASGSNCRLFLYHANIDPSEKHPLTREQWREAVDALEKKLGFTDQPRAVVMHVKGGREHCHVVWSRIKPETMTGISDSHNYRKHEEVSRDLEHRFGHERVQGAHIEREGKKRPTRTPTRADIQQQERAGKSGRAAVEAVKQVKADLTEIWRSTSSGREFAAALTARGYILARGDRRDFVVLDSAGAVHSLARRIEGVKTAAVRERMADVDRASLPTVAEAKAALASRSHHAKGGQRQPSLHQEASVFTSPRRDVSARQAAQEPRGVARRERAVFPRATGRAALWRHSARLVTVRARIGGFIDSGGRSRER
jgi:hypothetical protein